MLINFFSFHVQISCNTSAFILVNEYYTIKKLQMTTELLIVAIADKVWEIMIPTEHGLNSDLKPLSYDLSYIFPK